MAKPPALPESMIDLTAPALPEMDLAALASLAESDPGKFQAALGSALRKLVIQGFRTLQAPRNWKEQATAIELMRKVEGWDKGGTGNALPVGMVGVFRSVARRPVMEIAGAQEVEDEPGFE